MILVDEETAVMEAADLAALPEYSSTIPTGKTIGKRWKAWRRDYDGRFPSELHETHGHGMCGPNAGWMLGEYADEPDQVTWPGQIQIIWRRLLVV